MNNQKTIKQLAALWYKCLVDHHKDRDCHHYVIYDYQYDGHLIYRVKHKGYISKDIFIEFDNLSAAEEYLINALIAKINDEINWNLEEKEESLKPPEYWLNIKNELVEIIASQV